MTNKEPSFPFCLLTAFVKTTKKKQDLDEWNVDVEWMIVASGDGWFSGDEGQGNLVQPRTVTFLDSLFSPLLKAPLYKYTCWIYTLNSVISTPIMSLTL
jgi:hypothetical protein